MYLQQSLDSPGWAAAKMPACHRQLPALILHGQTRHLPIRTSLSSLPTSQQRMLLPFKQFANRCAHASCGRRNMPTASSRLRRISRHRLTRMLLPSSAHPIRKTTRLRLALRTTRRIRTIRAIRTARVIKTRTTIRVMRTSTILWSSMPISRHRRSPSTSSPMRLIQTTSGRLATGPTLQLDTSGFPEHGALPHTAVPFGHLGTGVHTGIAMASITGSGASTLAFTVVSTMAMAMSAMAMKVAIGMAITSITTVPSIALT